MRRSDRPARAFLVVLSLATILAVTAPSRAQTETLSYAQYLRQSAVPKRVIDTFLREHTWAQFDPELGYILGLYMPRDGIDRSRTISTTQRRGGEVVGSGAVVKGAAGGAALGAIGGAIAGNAGTGAAAGAAIGGLLGGVRRHQETNQMVTTTHTNPEYVAYTEAREAFKTAFDRCLAERAGADQ